MAEHPMADLRKKLKEANLLVKPTMKSWFKAILLLVVVCSLYSAHIYLPLKFGLMLIPITALFSTTLAMTGHEGVHSSACQSKAGNTSLAAIIFPLFAGFSMEYWREKHNVKHHAHPNVVNVDPDIHSWPFTFSQEEYKTSGPIRRFFQRHLQGWTFWPISLLVGHLMRFDGLKYIATKPFKSKKKRITKIWLLDTALILVHFTLWLALPILLGLSWQVTFGFYVLLWSLVGTCLTAIFIVGHAGRPIITEYDQNWRLQIETARRIKLGRIGSFFFVGLDYQIEHHLLPAMSHFNLPKAAPLVKEYAEERGWKYEELGFFRALWQSTVSLHHAWKTPSLILDEKGELNDPLEA
ncbi:acyl-CoA desaturase [Candidatus Poseidoniaceae archaeon]|nr:acyl-CoA desaturase [Euryarchaeota archaeon]MDA9166798.1 acyl-CoA desaturase [Candidatus Poseidoniaceae archaeon]MDA8609991.1 acyl-CoA desaturase [Euryarchaeota archaeon]MDA8680654.1 acyl-CoA desaturase [Euryarchaeota archaeon]MDA8700837.1 acyl-CoA desaturase [Euryarchaeota archaeon]